MNAGDPNNFLNEVSGLIHVGANIGQERDLYAGSSLAVIWIEPIPEIFSKLQANIAGYPKQRAFQYLVTDQDDREYVFNIANNRGSSSILDLKLHKDIWPDVHFTHSITLRSRTLCSVLRQEQVDISAYQALVIDTQGSELLVMKGAEPDIGRFDFIKTEVADFESYAGCCQLSDVTEFLSTRGFVEYSRTKFAGRKAGGSYYDVIYRRMATGTPGTKAGGEGEQ